jgi:hypothetical protein
MPPGLSRDLQFCTGVLVKFVFVALGRQELSPSPLVLEEKIRIEVVTVCILGSEMNILARKGRPVSAPGVHSVTVGRAMNVRVRVRVRVLFSGCKMKEGLTLLGVFMEGTTLTC